MQVLSLAIRKTESLVWDIQRFGLTPQKLLARCFNKSEPRIVLISVPKSGTHLVERVLCLHPRLYRPLLPTLHPNNIERFGGLEEVLRKLRPGGVLVTHLHYSDEVANQLRSGNVRRIFVIRDPRDIVVSRAFYVARNRKHPYHPYVQGLSLDERLRRAILGDQPRNYPSITQTLSWFAGWLREDGMFIIRFEDLTDANDRGEKVIRDLFAYIGIEVDKDLLRFISERIVSPVSPTFRKGKSGEWRSVLKGELYTLFMETAGNWLDYYGYTNE